MATTQTPVRLAQTDLEAIIERALEEARARGASQAEAAVSQLKRRQSTLVAELRSCSSECVWQVQQAAHEGIHNSLITDLRHDLTDIGRVLWRNELFRFGFTAVEDYLGFERMLGEDLFIAPFVSLYKAYDAYWQSQSWVNLGACLDAISGILALASLACPPLAFVAIGVGILGLAADAIAAADDEQGASWTQVGFDAVSVGLMEIGQGLHLADGPEAEEQGKSLWETVKGSWLDFDPDHPTPAAVGEFVTDRANDGVSVVQNQWQKDQGQ